MFEYYIRHLAGSIFTFFRWLTFSVLSGVVIGSAGILFHYCMTWANDARTANPVLILLLPVAGLVIVGAYHLLHDEKDTGTNLVLAAIHSGENIPLKMAPLIFVSTVMTHLFGGSAGREGAALQLGGSIGNSLGRLFRFDEKDQHVMIMCGMSAAFSALFGTPMAAAIFSMEVVSVGIMHYAALVPCVVSSLVAKGIADYCKVLPEQFLLSGLPEFSVASAVQISVLAILCAGISIIFCIMLHHGEKLYKKYLADPYLRIFTGGTFIVILTLVVKSQDYNGAGMPVIERCFENEYVPWAFLLKMIFTAVTLGCGYKGGEIVPSFVVGGTFGCLFGNLTGFAPGLCTAAGMGAVFCGVTNCPITSLLICFEMFGFAGMPYFLLSIALSYMLSGYYGLYRSQKIVYSKYKTEFINRRTH
ncbi:MAG: chloride channel protein [Lachnospiraceae bacterium]|nr:chloride channel protein [Lachnospiraceae bacterium]